MTDEEFDKRLAYMREDLANNIDRVSLIFMGELLSRFDAACKNTAAPWNVTPPDPAPDPDPDSQAP